MDSEKGLLLVAPKQSALAQLMRWDDQFSPFTIVSDIDQALPLLDSGTFDVLVTDTIPQKLRSIKRQARNHVCGLVLACEDLDDATVSKAQLFDALACPMPSPAVMKAKIERVRESVRHERQFQTMMDTQRKQVTAATDNALILDRIAALAHSIQTFDLNALYRTILDKIGPLFNARHTSIYSYDATQKSLTLRGHNHNHAEKHIWIRGDEPSLMSIALDSGEPLIISDVDLYWEKSNVTPHHHFPDRYVTRSCTIIPVKSSQGVEAIINLADRADEGVYNEVDVRGPVGILSEMIGASILNCNLYNEVRRQARHDNLTGLSNRRVLMEELEREMRRTQRYGTDLAFVMIDVDHFKKFNDTYGHQAGDAVLKGVAKILEESIRTDLDTAARYGGEEFSLILPETGGQGAVILCDRIRERIENHEFRFKDQSLNVTMSLGVASFDASLTVEEFIRQADQALYRAKAAGRNQVTM